MRFRANPFVSAKHVWGHLSDSKSDLPQVLKTAAICSINGHPLEAFPNPHSRINVISQTTNGRLLDNRHPMMLIFTQVAN